MRRSTRAALLVAIPILFVSVVMVARPSDQPPVSWLVLAAILGICAVALILGLRDLVRMFRAVDPEAKQLAARLGERSEQRFLIERWLRRSRWYRNVGGAAGVVGGLIAAGLGGLIIGGLAGVAIGSLLSELHLARRDRSGSRHRTAGLERRSLTTYWNPRHQVVLLLLAVMGAGLFLAGRFGWVGYGFRPNWALAATITVVIAVVLQWRVAVRRRPALPSSLRRSDNLVRSLAITQGIANPTIAVAVAFIAHSLWFSNPLLSLAAWFLAIALFWGGRRLGLDWLLKQPPLTAANPGPYGGAAA